VSRAANMQALTDDVKRRWPGVVVYGIGDTAHQSRASGHNEDDTPGSKPELEDSDNRPEHRAIDVMLGPAFTRADADALVARLVADPAARARLYYVIWNGYIWSRSNGWRKTKYTGSDQHTDHVHASGWAADDENTASWPAVAGEDDDMSAKAEAQIAEMWELLTRWRAGMPTMADGKTAISPVQWRIRDEKDFMPKVLSGLAQLAGKDFTDEPAIVKGVLAGLTPEAIAAAIPAALTEQVADELAKRMQG